MPIKLNPAQRRVLGVLIEKSFTTPGSYPLSLNTLMTGCNQLTCRDPVMHLSEGDVARAVYELQQVQLVKQADPDRNSRVNRFEHTVEARWGWSTRERAVMAELLLRGPATVGELKGNAGRMTPLDDLHYLGELLAGLASREPPFVQELPRQLGKSVTRYDHSLYPDDEPRSYSTGPVTPVAAAPASGGPAAAEATGDLLQRVERLERDVAALRAVVYEQRGREGNASP